MSAADAREQPGRTATARTAAVPKKTAAGTDGM
jgi:hypothetical protein